LSQSPEANNAGWPGVSAKVDLCVASWCNSDGEIINFSYFPDFSLVFHY